MKICFLIPSFNEEKTIGSIVNNLKKKNFDVIVVNDGSCDKTKEFAENEGAIVINHPKNLGKGASIKDGFLYFLNSTDCDAVIIMDGDGQHDANDINKFLDYANKYNCDMVIGNRMYNTKNMPIARFLTNKFTSFVISLISKQKIPDTQCGFRLIKRNVIKDLKLESTKYDTESEMIIDASKKGYKIASVPIRTIYTSRKSKINPFKDTIRFFLLIIRWHFRKSHIA